MPERGGFGWGFVLGAVAGAVVGAYVASGPGREQVDELRARTIELTGNPEELRARARAAAEPIRRAVDEGVSAARRRREELEGKFGGSADPSEAPGTEA